MPMQHLKHLYLTTKLSFYRKWRISTQISCFGFIIISFACLMSYLAIYFLLSMVSSIFQRDFELIHQKMSSNQLSIDIQGQKRLINNYFEYDIRMILRMNDIFQFSQRADLIVEPPIACFDKSTKLLDKRFPTSICCSINNHKDEEQINQLFFTYTSMMTELKMINVLEAPFFVSIDESHFLGVLDISLDKQTQSYDITQRQWYKDHITYMNNDSMLIQSSPYLTYNNLVGFTFTTNLTAINNTLLGIAGQNQNFETIQKIFQQYFNLSVINNEEQIIISPLYQKYHDQIYTIYDRTDLKLNETFWNYLQMHAQEDQFTIYFNNTYLISIIYMNNLKFYILLEKNLEIETKQQQEYFEEMYSNFQTLFNFTIYISFILITLSTVTYYFLIKLISKDIYDIMNITKLHLYSKSYFLPEKMTINKSKIQYKLYLAFVKLIYHRKKRNAICFDIERYSYPKKTYFEKFRVNYLNRQHITNDHKEFTQILSLNFIKEEIRRQSIKNNINLDMLDQIKQ